jgi:hypothetical protein
MQIDVVDEQQKAFDPIYFNAQSSPNAVIISGIRYAKHCDSKTSTELGI